MVIFCFMFCLLVFCIFSLSLSPSENFDFFCEGDEEFLPFQSIPKPFHANQMIMMIMQMIRMIAQTVLCHSQTHKEQLSEDFSFVHHFQETKRVQTSQTPSHTHTLSGNRTVHCVFDWTVSQLRGRVLGCAVTVWGDPCMATLPPSFLPSFLLLNFVHHIPRLPSLSHFTRLVCFFLCCIAASHP